ncbi:hypothetical protein GCM10009720_18550 [Yaniella flava]|uniref:LPXTG cell wall anchor domain-containing protein n=1 Tax=Yaniella flava TaxID=287930 RepID=A0ABN2UKT9_9MICC
MQHVMFWVHQIFVAAEPSIVDQTPNYGGPTTTVFYLAGTILLVGALGLWGIYLLRNRRK